MKEKFFRSFLPSTWVAPTSKRGSSALWGKCWGWLLDGAPDAPGELLFLPFLNGRGSPNSNPQARAAFISLNTNHNRAHLAKAVLEGMGCGVYANWEAAAQAIGNAGREQKADNALTGEPKVKNLAHTLPGETGAEFLPDAEKHVVDMRQLEKYRRLVKTLLTAL